MSFATLAGEHLSSLGVDSNLLTSLADSLKLDDILSIALRMTLIGLFAAGVRALFVTSKVYLMDLIFPSAHIPASDPAFNWVMTHLAQDQGVQSQLNSFRLTTADIRESKRDEQSRNSTWRKKENNFLVSKTDASFHMENVVGQVAPMNERDVFVKHQGNWLWIRRSESGFANSSSNKDHDHLRITGVFFQRDSIKRFLVAAHDVFFKKSDSEILIFHPSPLSGPWYDPLSRPARSWKSVILPGTIKDEVLEDVRDFLSDEQKEWYAVRGIPHRRGYLLHGRPGAGKTTLATAVASELKLDIYVVNPAARGMDDGKLNKAFRVCPPGNMILIEDIDCVMPPRRKTGKEGEEDDDEDDSSAPAGTIPEGDPGKGGYAKFTVTLSGLLNAIDGVSSQEDCVLFASTNHPDRLDEALNRPGRFDVHIAFHDSTHGQALALFKHFYPTSELPTPTSEKGTIQEKEQDQEVKLHELATEFANSVFALPKLSDDSQAAISMAALQGYLLRHKQKPINAAEHAAEWAKEMWDVQEQKAQKKLERIRQRQEKETAGREKLELAKQDIEDIAGDKVDADGPPTPGSPPRPALLNL